MNNFVTYALIFMMGVAITLSLDYLLLYKEPINNKIKYGYITCNKSYKGYIYMQDGKLYGSLDNDEIIIIDACLITLYNGKKNAN